MKRYVQHLDTAAVRRSAQLHARATDRHERHLLLARQRTKSWSFLPGGHVEPGERVETALVREIAEELGTDAKIAGFVGVVEHGYLDVRPGALKNALIASWDDRIPFWRGWHS